METGAQRSLEHHGTDRKKASSGSTVDIPVIAVTREIFHSISDMQTYGGEETERYVIHVYTSRSVGITTLIDRATRFHPTTGQTPQPASNTVFVRRSDKYFAILRYRVRCWEVLSISENYAQNLYYWLVVGCGRLSGENEYSYQI